MKKVTLFVASTPARIKQTRIAIESFYQFHSPEKIECLFLFCADSDSIDHIDLPKYVKIVTFKELSPYTYQDIKNKNDSMTTATPMISFVSALAKIMIIQYAFRKGYQQVAYFDGDVEVFGNMDAIFALLNGYDAVVTPHITEPLPNDEFTPSADIITLAGNYNAGFLALYQSPQIILFLDWWLEVSFQKGDASKDLLRCIEQGWLRHITDFVDDVKVLRNTGYNVAYWNVMQRNVRLDKGQWMTKDGPLKLFHYSAFDKDHPEKISVFQNRYEATGDLLELLKSYAAKLNS